MGRDGTYHSHVFEPTPDGLHDAVDVLGLLEEAEAPREGDLADDVELRRNSQPFLQALLTGDLPYREVLQPGAPVTGEAWFDEALV